MVMTIRWEGYCYNYRSRWWQDFSFILVVTLHDNYSHYIVFMSMPVSCPCSYILGVMLKKAVYNDIGKIQAQLKQ